MKKHLFSKLTVVFCIAYAAIYAAYAARAQSHGADMVGLVVAVLGFFGSELALSVLNRIFKKEDTNNDRPDAPAAVDDYGAGGNPDPEGNDVAQSPDGC